MPNDRINLIMVVHNHQPVGNFDWVFKEAYDKAYLPFIKILERHPKIKMALHYSGCLLDWLEAQRPEFLDTLKKLVKAGQVEMVAGGYYEPILPLIPDKDKLGQIKMHVDFIKRHTGYESRGAWLTERIWEPYLARIFSQAGISYTVVDDSHFELAGKSVEHILGYYVTEEEGFMTNIFPSSKKLRYSMPFKLPRETIDYLKSVATPEGTRAVTFGDDGEKFGFWPHTYKWVYEEGWLESFFKALEENSAWIRMLTPSEYIKDFEPLGRIYIPCASYPEMLEWSGGYFRNFLVKYPEANWMQKKMLHVSERVAALKAKGPRVSEARTSLYKAQCNCAYWHGVFGGLYLHHLRAAVYQNLIDAEKIAADLEKVHGPLKIDVLDIDKDGADEIILENGPLGLSIDPREGGVCAELDYRPRSLNLVNTLARRPEAYHKKLYKSAQPVAVQKKGNEVSSIHDLLLAKEDNLDEFLSYDWHAKAFMIEHFLPSGSGPGDFSKAAFRELGDFVGAPFKYDFKKETNALSLVMEREGCVSGDSGPKIIKLDKTLTLEAQKSGLRISYKLRNMMDEEADLWFGSEFNLSLRDPEFCKTGELLNINSVQISDEWFKISVGYYLSKNADLWFYPVETISESEGGLERTYQQLCLLFHWRVGLAPKQSWSADIALEIKQ
ncbi:MAG: DUF1926 domain-containing protein [Candidatus Omnitrophica bacterium]|nr:DUF1926 domain-containing protein [Candidatus Omnitrophota bacterium]